MKKLSFACAALAVALLAVPGCKKESPASTPGVSNGTAPSNPSGGVTFQKKALPVGQKIQETEKMEMNMSMTVDMTALGGKPETTKMAKRESTVRNSEVLASNEDAPTKLKVTYTEKTDVDVENGEEKKTPTPVAGKTYIVEVKGEAIVVTGVDGKPVSKDEEEIVQADNKDLGQIDTVSESLHGKTIKLGEEVPELTKVIESELTKGAQEEDSTSQVSGVKVKLREEKAGIALFDVAVIFTQKEAGMGIRMDLKGTLGVRTADTQPAELSLKGPVTIDMGDATASQGMPPMKISGSGDMSMSLSQNYL